MKYRLSPPNSRTLSAVPPSHPTEFAPVAGDRELDKFFMALSDQTRRGILQLLRRQELSVGEIVANFDLSQPTISRHLSVLKEARLVIDRRCGQHVMYRLSPEALASSAGKFFAHFDSCGELVSRG